jgi:hypothetical protein
MLVNNCDFRNTVFISSICVAHCEEAMSGSGDHDDESYVVKLRGLPWSTTVDEILKFFSKYEVSGSPVSLVRCAYNGILLNMGLLFLVNQSVT